MRRNGRCPVLHQPPPARRSRVPTVASAALTHQSFLVLCGRAAQHLFRRWWQYALLTLGVFGAEAAVYLTGRNDTTLVIAQLLFPPLLTAITYALVAHDEGIVEQPFRRAFERWWLVIVVDCITSLAVGLAFGSFHDRDAVSGVILLAVNLSLIYADVFVVVEEPSQGLLLLRSAGRSTITAWNGLENIARSLALLALQLAPSLFQHTLQERFEHQHLMLASFWANVPLGILLVPPLSALTVLVYLDATGHEAKRTCGE